MLKLHFLLLRHLNFFDRTLYFHKFYPFILTWQLHKNLDSLCEHLAKYGLFVFIYTVVPLGYVYIYLNSLVGECLNEYSGNEHEKNEALTIISIEIILYWCWKLHYNLPAVDDYVSIFSSYFFRFMRRKKIFGLWNKVFNRGCTLIMAKACLKIIIKKWLFSSILSWKFFGIIL